MFPVIVISPHCCLHCIWSSWMCRFSGPHPKNTLCWGSEISAPPSQPHLSRSPSTRYQTDLGNAARLTALQSLKGPATQVPSPLELLNTPGGVFAFPWLRSWQGANTAPREPLALNTAVPATLLPCLWGASPPPPLASENRSSWAFLAVLPSLPRSPVSLVDSVLSLASFSLPVSKSQTFLMLNPQSWFLFLFHLIFYLVSHGFNFHILSWWLQNLNFYFLFSPRFYSQSFTTSWMPSPGYDESPQIKLDLSQTALPTLFPNLRASPSLFLPTGTHPVLVSRAL